MNTQEVSDDKEDISEYDAQSIDEDSDDEEDIDDSDEYDAQSIDEECSDDEEDSDQDDAQGETNCPGYDMFFLKKWLFYYQITKNNYLLIDATLIL